MGSAASWQTQPQRKAQSVFLCFGVQFDLWRDFEREGGSCSLPFIMFHTTQGTASPRMSWHMPHPNQSWCLSKALDKWTLWQVPWPHNTPSPFLVLLQQNVVGWMDCLFVSLPRFERKVFAGSFQLSGLLLKHPSCTSGKSKWRLSSFVGVSHTAADCYGSLAISNINLSCSGWLELFVLITVRLRSCLETQVVLL